MAQGVTISVDDEVSTDLARTLLVIEIGTAVLTCLILIDMTPLGDKIERRIDRWRDQWKRHKEAARRDRLMVGELLYETGRYLDEQWKERHNG